MIRVLLSISARERLMLLALAVVGVLIWASHLWDRLDSSREALSAARREAGLQQTWLNNEAFFQAQLERTLGRVNPADMLSATGLTGLVDSYAREHQLRHDLSNPTVAEGTVFSSATLRVNFRNIPLDQLLRFYLFLEARHPYVALDGIALVPNRADPRLLNARLRLSAIRIGEAPPAISGDTAPR